MTEAKKARAAFRKAHGDYGWRNSMRCLLKTIQRDQDVMILRKTRNAIETYDRVSGQELRYRIRKYNDTERRALIRVAPGIESRNRVSDLAFDIMRELSLSELLNLKYIFIVEDYEGLRYLTDELGLDPDSIPGDIISRDKAGNLIMHPDCIGVTWVFESIAVINLSVLTENTEELIREVLPESNFRQEFERGFCITLLHELRHVQNECCPYELPWLDEHTASESAVEGWARYRYDEIMAGRAGKEK